MPKSALFKFPQVQSLAAVSALTLLAACGGSAGGGPIGTGPAPTPMPSPTPTPTPSPTPTPTPTPAPSNFNTQEFRESDGPEFHGAITSWEAGATGEGAIIAIVDSGIDSDSPEFAGRIHPASADVVGNRGIDGEDDHGTNVALVAAAARNNIGVMGIAFDAQVLAIRADDPGSCASDTPQDSSLSCLFSDRAIAAGVDLAVSEGAKVVNLSLGGGSASQVLLNTIARAANADVVIVVSAGNSGDGSDPAIDPDQPDPFATSLLQAGGANVIIVGSIDANGQLSGFSNRAGDARGSYLTARGERICCVYLDGELFVEDINGQEFVTVFSGTSFSAPQVAGAVALLAQAFPNLSGAEIVEILLESATDAGTTGIDALFGRGILDIARAVAPAGTTTIAGQQTAFGLNDLVAAGSPAMGDTLGRGQLSTIITDKYDRAYEVGLSAGFTGASIIPRLHGAVDRQGRAIIAGSPGLSLAFNVSDDNRVGGLQRLTSYEVDGGKVVAARIAARIAPRTKVGIAFAQGSQGLVTQLQGHSTSAFRIAPGATGDSGFFQASNAALAFRQQIGPWGLTLHAENGETRQVFAPRLDEALYRPNDRFPNQSFGLALDREFAGLAGTLGMSWRREDRSVLGAWFNPAIGQGGADTAFLDGMVRWQIGNGWVLGGDLRLGVTRPQRVGMIVSGSRFFSQAWAFDLARGNVLASGDTLGLRISQPLRVEGGGLNLNLPATYDYATETPGYAVQHLSLSPQGRELLSELAWAGPVIWGRGTASLFYRHEQGHYADSPGDVGAMVSFSADF